MKLLLGRLGVVLVALTVSLITLGAVLGVARANHPTPDPKPGWYVAGGANADRVLSKGEGHLATWWYTRLFKDGSWRAYWIIRNVTTKPITIGCGGYKDYGLKGYRAKIYNHSTFNFSGHVQDAKCVHLGKNHTETLKPDETVTSWAEFKYAGKKGTCTKLSLPTGPKAPAHVGYTKCVNPYGIYLGQDHENKGGYRLPFVGEETITNGPQCGETHGSNPNKYQASKEAIDFALDSGTPVYAARAGEIDAAYNAGDKDFGNLIILKHDNGPGEVEWSYYAHLSEFNKTTGSVKQGELIGYSGNTGNSTNPHLHFEVRLDSNRPNYPDGNDTAVSIRDIPGIEWKSEDPNNPCQGVGQPDGVAVGAPV